MSHDSTRNNSTATNHLMKNDFIQNQKNLQKPVVLSLSNYSAQFLPSSEAMLSDEFNVDNNKFVRRENCIRWLERKVKSGSIKIFKNFVILDA